MTKRKTELRLLTVLLASAATIPQAAIAQIAQAGENPAASIGVGQETSSGQQVPVSGNVAQEADVAEDIVVTAQRRSENLSRVPLSVTAFTGAALASTGVTDPTQLTRVVPGLTFAKSGSNTPIYTLRGVGFNTRNISSTSPVGIYVNEVAYAYPYMSGGPLFDIDQIEVLKGPQGTLYGRNTTGGLINFITSRGTDTFKAGVTATIGNYQTYNLEGYVSGPLSDGITARLAAITENSDKGWQRSVTRGDRLGEKERYAARLSLDFDRGGPLTAQFTGNYWRDKSDTQAAQAVALRADVPPFLPPTVGASILSNPNARDANWTPESAGVPPLTTNAEFYGLSGRLNFALNDNLSIISLTGYSHLVRDDSTDLDGTPFQFANFRQTSKLSSFSQELRLAGTTGALRYTLGGYYAQDKVRDSELLFITDATTNNLLRFFALGIPQTTYTAAQISQSAARLFDSSDQRSETKSGFVNLDYTFSDQFRIIAGARYSADSLRFRGCSYDADGNDLALWNTLVNNFAGVPGTLQRNACLTYRTDAQGRAVALQDLVRQTLKQNNVSFRVSGNYTPNADLLLYASISRGYKNGAFPTIPANLDTQLAPAGQERLIAYEGGIKAKLFDRRVIFNGAAFYYDYSNKQTLGRILDPVFTTLERLVNIPKSRVFGAELDISWRVTRELSLKAAGTFLNSKIERYSGFDAAGVPQNFQGKEFTFTPKTQLSLIASYDRPISTDLGIETTLAANYQSRSFGDLENSAPFRIDGYGLLNANIALYSLDNQWRVGVFAKNLTDKYYATTTFYLRDTISRYAGMPRTYGLTVGYNF
jgi:iron complex outermembrane recepter protein